MVGSSVFCIDVIVLIVMCMVVGELGVVELRFLYRLISVCVWLSM